MGQTKVKSEPTSLPGVTDTKMRRVTFEDEYKPDTDPFARLRTNKRVQYADVPYLNYHNPAATTTHWWI